jgi:hypothetical protein
MVAATEIHVDGRPKKIETTRNKNATGIRAKFDFAGYWRIEMLRTRLRSISLLVPSFILMRRIPLSGTVI